MILNVSHVTTYRYDAPVRSAVQSLRLTPSVFDGQRTQSWAVSVDDGECGGRFRDGAGDWVEGWSVRGPAEQIVVRVSGQVETADLTGMLRGHRETVAPVTYLRESVLTRADSAVALIARQATGKAIDPLDAAHKLSAAVSEAIAYRPGTTDMMTTAAEAVALGEGVCQDHAHALIAAARVVGMPARYVSGYLHSDADGEGHDASHAWAELWVDTLGWVGFDPANRCCPDERYIRLGSGYDARDAAPIRGVARGSPLTTGSETLEVAVAVRSVQQ
jgi:transglutaminase-like putative cysteine protease